MSQQPTCPPGKPPSFGTTGPNGPTVPELGDGGDPAVKEERMTSIWTRGVPRIALIWGAVILVLLVWALIGCQHAYLGLGAR